MSELWQELTNDGHWIQSGSFIKEDITRSMVGPQEIRNNFACDFLLPVLVSYSSSTPSDDINQPKTLVTNGILLLSLSTFVRTVCLA